MASNPRDSSVAAAAAAAAAAVRPAAAPQHDHDDAGLTHGVDFVGRSRCTSEATWTTVESAARNTVLGAGVHLALRSLARGWYGGVNFRLKAILYTMGIMGPAVLRGELALNDCRRARNVEVLQRGQGNGPADRGTLGLLRPGKP